MRALAGAGASVDQAEEDGYTPLIMAVQNGYLEVVRALVEAGASVDKVLWLGSLLPRLLTTPNGSQRLPTAPYDYKHTLLLASNDSH